jgi:hypothetical protein
VSGVAASQLTRLSLPSTRIASGHGDGSVDGSSSGGVGGRGGGSVGSCGSGGGGVMVYTSGNHHKRMSKVMKKLKAMSNAILHTHRATTPGCRHTTPGFGA